MADHDFTLKGNAEVNLDKQHLEKELKSAAKTVDGAVKQIVSDSKTVKSVLEDIDLSKTTKGIEGTAKALEKEAVAISSAVAQEKTLVELEQERARIASRIDELQGKKAVAEKVKPQMETAVTRAELKSGTESRAYQNATARLEQLIQTTAGYDAEIQKLTADVGVLDTKIAGMHAKETTIINPEDITKIETALNTYRQYQGVLSETATENAKILQAQMDSADKSTILKSKTDELQSAYRGLITELYNYIQAEREAKEQQASMDVKSFLGTSKLGGLEKDLQGVSQLISGLESEYAKLGNLPEPQVQSKLLEISGGADAVNDHLRNIVSTWQKIYNETSRGLSGQALENYKTSVEGLNQSFLSLFGRLDKLPQYTNDITNTSTIEQRITSLQWLRDELMRVVNSAPQGIQSTLQQQIDGISNTITTLETKLRTLNETNRARSGTVGGGGSVLSDIEVGAQKADFSIIQLIQRLNELKTTKRSMDLAGVDKGSQEYQNIERQINNVEAGIRQYYSELNSTAQATNGVTASTERLSSAVRSISNSRAGITVGDVFKSIESGARNGFNSVMKLLSALKSLAGGILSKIKHGFDRISGSAEKAFSSKTLKRNLTTLLKYTIGVRSLYFAFRRLRSAIKEGINNLVQFQSATNETNAQMTEFKTSMLYLKNAWAAAFAPVINVVMPILTALMDALATVGNAIARFFAALTGQSTVIQALRVSVGDYAKSLGGAGGSAKKAADEQKKLNDRLAAFDDLNVLGKDKDDEDTSPSGGGGGGANMPSVNEMFERIDTPMSRLAEMLRDAWETGNGFELGKTLATSLSNSFDEAYQWLTGEGYVKAMKIANLIGTFIDGILDVDDLGTNFGRMFGAAIVLGLDFINKIVTPERFYKIGVRISEALNEAIPMIVPKIGQTLGNILHSAISGAYGFLTNADFVEWGKSFGRAINNFFTEMGEINPETNKTGWEELGASIHEALKGAMVFAINALNETDTQEIVDAIGEFFSGLDLSSLKSIFEVLLHQIWDFITDIISNSPELQNGLLHALFWGKTALEIGATVSVAKLFGGMALQGAVQGLFTTGLTGALGGNAVRGAVGSAMAQGLGGTAVRTSLRTVFTQAFNGIPQALSSINWAGIVAGLFDVGATGLGLATIWQGGQGIANRLPDIIESANNLDISGWEAFTGGLREVGNSIASIPNTISTINELDMSFSDLAEGARIAWDEIGNPDAAQEGVEWAQRIVNANQGLYDSYTDWDGIEADRQERVRNMLNGMQEDYANYYGQMGREAVGIAQSIDFAYQTLADNEAQRERERQSRVQGILTANSINEGQRSIAEYYQMLGEAELLQERVDMINQGYREMADRYRDLAQRETLIDSMNESYREMAERAAETAKQSAETSTAIANSFNEASASVTASAETMERESANKFASIGNAFNTEIQEKAIPVATTVTEKFSQSFIAVGEASKLGATAVSDNFGLAFENINQNATDTWTSIKETLSDGGDVFVAFSDGMNTVTKSLLNGLIDGINLSITKPLQELTTALNAIRNVDVDGTKPFAGIPVLRIPTIPHLAQGAVIPPNKEFMAVLGDQTSGTNIEAPLDTIRQAVGEEFAPYFEQMIQATLQVVQAVNSKNLVIGDREIGKANARYTSQQKLIRGTSL